LKEKSFAGRFARYKEEKKTIALALAFGRIHFDLHHGYCIVFTMGLPASERTFSEIGRS
jgi:hypothetical protein